MSAGLSAYYARGEEFLRSLSGWRRHGAAAMAGAAMALGFPPFGLAFMPWLCLPALIFILRGAESAREAFAVGWMFAFGCMVAGMHWTAGSMFVDIASFWWAVPLAAAGLPAAFALYYGLASSVAWRFGLARWDGALVFALLWFLADYGRGHLFTGFPWNLLGHVWSASLPILQTTSVFGIYGLTLAMAIAAVLPAFVLSSSGCGAEGRRVFSPFSAVLCAAFVGLFAVAAIWGNHRLGDAEVLGSVEGIRFRLVQPNVNQGDKWKAEEREGIFRSLLSLSGGEGAEDNPSPPTHVIWPETASAYYLAENLARRREIAAALPKEAILITGSIRRERLEGGLTNYYNSVVAIDGKANLIAGYDKFHLVPFGEYMPLRRLLPEGLTSLVGSDFSGGVGPYTMRVPALPPFSPLVCYESIFSGDVAEKGDRPRFLLNITNDAWFENTIGPYQHLEMARLRAIEEGMPLLRVANKGFTAIIDAYGRTVAQKRPDESGYVDGNLPFPASERTFFSEHGEIPLWSFFSLCAFAAFCAHIHRRRKQARLSGC